MAMSMTDAKTRLDEVLAKQRVDFYKPIQVAEVLRRSRLEQDIDVSDLTTYRLPSIRWRDVLTRRLSGKVSTSSARYQHDIWNETAIPPAILTVLDAENKRTDGAVERYIFLRYAERQGTVGDVIAAITTATPADFKLPELLALFVRHPGIRRSIDKAYEIVAHSLFETVVTTLGATVTVRVPAESADLLAEFSDLARVLLGLEDGATEWTQEAHIYRVGVTNAADRGLDMWANFGPAVQVKHLTLDDRLAVRIVDQVESDAIVIVCRDADAKTIQVVTRQIGWGKRVRGIVRESELVAWYERCLRGKYAGQLGKTLLEHLAEGFKAEFPQNDAIEAFLEVRSYVSLKPPEPWLTEADITL